MLQRHTSSNNRQPHPLTPRVLRPQPIPRIAPTMRRRHQPRISDQHAAIHAPVLVMGGVAVAMVGGQRPVEAARAVLVAGLTPEEARLARLSPSPYLARGAAEGWIFVTTRPRMRTLTGVAHDH